MKHITVLLALAITSIGFSQDNQNEFHKLVHSEMKAAAGKMNFRENPNTQNYNITYHKLEFTVDPAVYFISGIVTTTFSALSDMSTVTFDLTNQLTVSSVKQDNTNLTFTQNTNNELVITLPATLTAGNSTSVIITYSGAPATGEQAFTTSTHNGSPVLYTLSEPFGARDWWPCKQDLNDKVTSIDVYITAPFQYTSVSNGLEQTQTINGVNKTTHFHHGYPIPAYLIAIAVTNYQIYEQQGGLGTTESPFFPIINYIYPETASSTQTSLSVTPGIINTYESLFTPYPFRNEKYGHAQFGWGGGMEHTTVSFMGGWNRDLISHEMAHQWFGNKVTCGSWKDIWLNEGITEYLSGLIVENMDGAGSFLSWKSNKINSITSQPDGNLYLTDEQLTDADRIFDYRLTYNKGSMVTNMIRFKMGDDNFFQAMRNYLNDPALAYEYATTPQLQAHLEAVSGMNFTDFFNDWIYKEGYPIYNITAQNWGAGLAKITINQTTSHSSVPFFEMPVPIRLIGENEETQDVILENTTNNQDFIIDVPFRISQILFDPKKNIISRNSTTEVLIDNFDFITYPNPCHDILTIKLPADVELEKAEIYNMLGQLNLKENNPVINLSPLSNGVYILIVNTSAGTFYKNLIKE
ncbi:M1 family metalloprotease precursor [Flavobacterium enshiense DK69]|uniref:Aminopeptidase N n=1 Tax=Flavobacterium enshiense DK69 TaxID=1107311 RepID=V6SAK3_9FLAO|nr:M1 family aminopeptidase [Flavobacterium enshiense]ESU23688.1 M1 family metalloprotease precursor [Flavobacterium enshiense DK69]KGO96181.1 peptidase M1 [Flavobacterium enshiense DK69]